MRFWFATLGFLLCAQRASAIDCTDLFERAKFWKPSRAVLTKALKDKETQTLFSRFTGMTQATLLERKDPRLDARTIEAYAALGTGLHAFRGTVFNYDPVSGLSRRVPKKIGDALVNGLGVDPNLVPYSVVFTNADSAKELFLSRGPLSKWVTLGSQLRGKVTLHRGIEFFELSFFASNEMTAFVLGDNPKSFNVFGRKPQSSPCANTYCSKQMKRLLDPDDNRAEVAAGEATLAFVRELTELGFAFTGNLPISNAR